MNKTYCIKNNHWHETLNEMGKKNVCTICCIDFETNNCDGKLIDRKWSKK